MAIGFRQSSSADIGSVPATTTITKPTGTASTDVLVVVFGNDRSGTPVNATTAPAGWTGIFTTVTGTGGGNTITLDGWWALGSVANLGFANNHTGVALQQGWVCLAFTGVDTTTPVDATGTTNSGTGASSITANAVTPATTGAVKVIALISWLAGTWSFTGGTLKQNAGTNADASCGYDLTALPAGVSTGTTVCSTTGGSTGQILCAAPFALKPAGGGAAAQTPGPPFPGLPPAVLAM